MANEPTRQLATTGPSDWQVMIEQAKVLVESGFLPSYITKPAQAVAIMMSGKELGIPTMTALRSIVLIKGKVDALR